MEVMSKPLAPDAPEFWRTRTTDTDVAVLTIPGALQRTRTFDVDVQLQVRLPDPAKTAKVAKPAELGLSLEVDGSRQWSRTTSASTPADMDSLEYHCRLVLEPGRDCRLRARAALRHCALMSLSLSAVENGASGL